MQVFPLQASPKGRISSRNSQGITVRGICTPERRINDFYNALSHFGSLLLRPEEGMASYTKTLVSLLLQGKLWVSYEEEMSVDLESDTAG